MKIQNGESINKNHNFVGRDVVRNGRSCTLKTFCEQQRILENEAVGRFGELFDEDHNYKGKIKRSRKRDNIIARLQSKLKRGDIRTDTYWKRVARQQKQYDLKTGVLRYVNSEA